MTSQNVLNYLGRPCRIAQAKGRFEIALDESRQFEQRDLVQQIGGLLNSLDDREEQLGNVIALAHRLLPNNTDDDEVRALLAVAIPYHHDLINKLSDLAGHVLAVLENGKLVEVSHV